MKTSTTVVLIFALLFILAPAGQAEEHCNYKDAQRKLVISSPLGSNILRKLDLPEFRKSQQWMEGDSARSTNKLEGSPKHEQEK